MSDGVPRSRLHQWFEDKNKKVHRDLEDLKMKEETQKHEEESALELRQENY